MLRNKLLILIESLEELRLQYHDAGIPIASSAIEHCIIEIKYVLNEDSRT